MNTATAAPASKSAGISSADKKIIVAYKKYVTNEVKPTETPMSLAKFTEGYAAREANKEKENAITISPEVMGFLEARGWAKKLYVPTKGTNAGKEGEYLVNTDADVSGSGFIKISKDRLEKTRERALLFLEMSDIVLGHKTIAEVLA